MVHQFRTLLCLVVFVAVFSNLNAQNPCTTTRGSAGQCILIQYCPSLYAITQKRPLYPADSDLVLSEQCGSQGGQAKVCCSDVVIQPNNVPQPCRTPNGNLPGTCISLKSCKYLYDLLKVQPITDESRELLRSSKCGASTSKIPNVCCPNTTPTTTTEAPPVPDIETGTGLSPKSALLPPDCGKDVSGDKVLGGEAAGLLEFPWMVLLQYRNRNGGHSFNCGGTIISNRYVLTAAHCVKGEIVNAVGTLVNVRVGEYDTQKEVDCVVNQGCNNGSTIDVPIEEIIAHAGWSARDSAKLNDLALLRLARPLVFNSFVRPICIPNKGIEPQLDDITFVAGWGLAENNVNSNIKLKLKVPIRDMQACQTPYQKLISTIKLRRDLQFCAGGEADKDSCRGDSGGPAMKLHVNEQSGDVQWYLSGVISFGPDPCGIENVPAIYTKVSAHVNWILSKMRP